MIKYLDPYHERCHVPYDSNYIALLILQCIRNGFTLYEVKQKVTVFPYLHMRSKLAVQWILDTIYNSCHITRKII